MTLINLTEEIDEIKPEQMAQLYKNNEVINDGNNIKSILLDPEVYLKIFDEKYVVEHNPPLVETVKLTDVIMAGMTIYPQRLDIQYGNIDDSKFEWYVTDKSQKKFEWVLKSESFHFTPSTDDVDKSVKLGTTETRLSRTPYLKLSRS